MNNMPNSNLPKPIFRREIRLGLVVYGGVALAIYMNGVCREFYNAVRGRGIYKLIKALTDSDIVIDIISGTSAGGINGVLLSYALANSNSQDVVDFSNFTDIWRQSGDIFQLMQEPRSKSQTCESILNGEGYYQAQLETAFRKAFINKHPAPQGEWVSDFNELDLFVTGTDVFGRIYKAFDDTGCVIEIKDHRAVFQLKHRRGRKEPFNPIGNHSTVSLTSEETYQALAKLCRITSCFPIAFPMVDVELKGSNKISQALVEWGQLERRELVETPPANGYKLYFIDGGVLDNRPFSYTLKEIYYRTANRPVERKLFYIDPSPDRFAEQASFQAMRKPNTLQVIQESLVGIPMYESIGNDLEWITSHNEKVRRYKSILMDVTEPDYSSSVTSDAIDVKESIYLQTRLISLRDRVLPLLLKMEPEFKVDAKKQAYLEKAANLLFEEISEAGEQENRDKIRQAFGQQIRDIDVEYALRKHFYLLEYLYRRLDRNSNSEDYKKLSCLAECLSRQIKLLEVIREAINQLLSYPLVSDSFYELVAQGKQKNQVRGLFYERLLRLHRFLLNAHGLEKFSPVYNSNLEEVPADIFQALPTKAAEKASYYSRWLSQQRISSILAQLHQKINTLTNQAELDEKIWRNVNLNYKLQETEELVTILQQVEQASEALIVTSQLQDWEKILHQFKGFRYLDKIIYPFEYLMDINEKQQIQIVRISPGDAKLGLGQGKTIEDKLAGDTLYAFGGFFKKSWRSNDILWGRLDGLNRIFEALLTVESIKKFPEFLERQCNYYRGTLEFEAFTETYFEALIDEALPEVQERDRQEIISYLHELKNPEKLTEEQIKIILDRLIQSLVLAGHREIIKTDLPIVLEDEIAEQLSWNQQRVKPNQANVKKAKQSLSLEEQPKYHPVPGYFDRSVTTLAAAKLAEETIVRISQGNIEKFFREKYNVGQETVLDSIPRLILANISTRCALIVRNIVLTVLGDRSSILRRSLTFNILDKALQLFYWWLQFIQPVSVQPANYQPIFLGIQLILLLLAIAAVAIALLQIWFWLLITLGATLLFWLLELIRRTSSKGR